MKIQLRHRYNDLISLENLCLAWQEFIVGKKQKKDVQIFSRNLMDNILSLHEELVNRSYRHGGYESFFVNDPKRRHIHKASVRDRLLHHAIYRLLYPFFDKTFAPDSFSCRLGKGTHKALQRFKAKFYQVSQNNTRTCWVLKCDIRKFFDSVDHQILLDILKQYIPDKDILQLLENVIESYSSNCHPCLQLSSPRRRGSSRSFVAHGLPPPIRSRASFRLPAGRHGGNDRLVGLPLGNLTSQLFANVYMNVFDQFVKHQLKAKYYVRYADDFVFLFSDKQYLENILPKIQTFLKAKLRLDLHPNKIYLKTFASGIDYLGWVNFPTHRILRKITGKRILHYTKENFKPETLQSYLGLLKHGDTFKIRERLLMNYWINGSVP